MWLLAPPYSICNPQDMDGSYQKPVAESIPRNDQLSPGHAIRRAKAVSRRTCHRRGQQLDS